LIYLNARLSFEIVILMLVPKQSFFEVLSIEDNDEIKKT